jgi:hypothetical protein
LEEKDDEEKLEEIKTEIKEKILAQKEHREIERDF